MDGADLSDVGKHGLEWTVHCSVTVLKNEKLVNNDEKTKDTSVKTYLHAPPPNDPNLQTILLHRRAPTTAQAPLQAPHLPFQLLDQRDEFEAPVVPRPEGNVDELRERRGEGELEVGHGADEDLRGLGRAVHRFEHGEDEVHVGFVFHDGAVVR